MVEKRKHPLLGLFLNQFVYAFLSFVIVTTVAGKFQIFFGVFFLLLFLSGIYGYAHKAGTEHQKSYSKVRPHVKFPFAYSLIGLAYLWIPLGIHWLCHHFWVTFVVLFWEAPYYFAPIIFDNGTVNFMAGGIFSGLISAAAFLGYWAGSKQFYLIKLLHKLLYRPVESPSEETK